MGAITEFQRNEVRENIYLASRSVGGLFFVSEGNLRIEENTFEYNGNTEGGLGVVGLRSGTATLERNQFNNLYCALGCIASLETSSLGIRNNSISQLVGRAIHATQGSAVAISG